MPAKSVIQVRRDTAANWTSANPTLASGEIGFETDTAKFKIGDGSTAWTSLAYQNASGPQGATGPQGAAGAQGASGAQGPQGAAGGGGSGVGGWIFGSGSDGDVTITGSTTLTRDMNYNNLTLNAGAALNPAGYRIRVAGTLTISSAPANAIRRNGNSGLSSSGNGGGAAGGSIDAQWVTQIRARTNNAGAGGGTGAGSTNGIGTNWLGYGSGGQSAGGGGAGASGAGGSTAGCTANIWSTLNWNYEYGADYVANDGANSLAVFLHGLFTGGGGGGGGDGTNFGGGGGGSGSSGGAIYIAAKTIARGTNTTAAIIQAKGGSGGNGASRTVGNVGGGGGGCGGSGGVVTIFYESFTGSTITDAIDVSGGNGGAGGTGAGTGANGNGGGAGNGGFVLIHNVSTGVSTYQGPTAGLAAQTGGTTAGKTATTWRCSL